MTKFLELIGMKRSADAVPLFATWHSYAAVLIAAVVIATLARVMH